jgi:hypothetical protein
MKFKHKVEPTCPQLSKDGTGLLDDHRAKNSYVVDSLDYAMTANADLILQTSSPASFQDVTDPTALNCRLQVNLRQTFGQQEPENTSPLKLRNHLITERLQTDDFEDDLRSRSNSGLELQVIPNIDSIQTHETISSQIPSIIQQGFTESEPISACILRVWPQPVDAA